MVWINYHKLDDINFKSYNIYEKIKIKKINRFSENVTSLQQQKKKKKKRVKISLDRIIINQLHYILIFTNNKSIYIFLFVFFSKWIPLSLTLKMNSYTYCYEFGENGHLPFSPKLFSKISHI